MSKRGRIGSALLVGACLFVAVPAAAQDSASFRVRGATLNAGGHPDQGVTPTSASFRMTLGSIGDPVAALGPAAAGHALDAGLAASFAPPGEIRHVRFDDPATMTWDPDGSVGDYAVYQGLVADPLDPGSATCAAVAPTATATVAAVGAPGEALFFLVTARNRLGEEGPTGPARPDPAGCP